ncbi:Pimeloyl-ACP methyl ester carboxylesterase [Actinopolymorpha cephalotaxi]|uniref:Pimeloyl-ACP methyl ester carboxylesterase n=1 Tax=Actinopolymorpha cephalotaxi TaxID=504797 RepID=A0A1I2KBU3_9ACTN|nr:alpha/beta hydrolase [Actinopolymorpha cephalotaxi]NYH85913.1 pimeloyl-ACP methyl ester carboxylesterase [Actinopolymorpha cephalotaxi]SFF62561.1 Pimeloyl-ACP methyl ester carboxylesterase [Actinopolymorpha cephalotaxi]
MSTARSTAREPETPKPRTEAGRTGHIAWTRRGGRPEILFLHGFSDSGACWDPVVSALRPGWGVLATDARGHGESGLPEEPFGHTAHARDAAAVLDDQPGLDPDGVLVVGHSMGAVTAAALAGLRPDLVRAVVLEDPPPGERESTPGPGPAASPDTAPAAPSATPPAAPSATPRPGPPRQLPDWLRAVRALDPAARIARGRADNPEWSEEELVPWARSKEQFDVGVFERPSEPFVPLRELLAKVTCPVLLIHGDVDRGSLLPPAIAAACAMAAGGDVEVARIDGAGHSVRRDRPGPYVAALEDFLRRHRG